MVHWPIRKCLQAFKVSIFFIIVVSVFALFEHWRGGKRNAFATGDEAEYESQIIADEARVVPGLGEGGVAVYLEGNEKRLGELSEKKLAMNVYLSDRIPYNRTLKDFRNPACANVVYDAELPSASVIIIFHNEPYSVVIRTIWNVINTARRDQPWHEIANYYDKEGKRTGLGYPGQDPNSPFVYLKEIILVDDNSTLPELKGKLSHYIRTRLPPDLIKILRLPERQGLMTARMTGARSARGDVLIFLDAHCEGGPDWLRPLLQRIRHKRDAVVTPLIDVVDQTTFQLDAADNFQVGGFTFMGHFTWIDVPEREKERRGSVIAPTWSPTMAGGLFAINRQYYWELGAYDEQMAGWGGENLELSFRIWQCGGTLETIPCSRIGHVFRRFHPYGLPANTDTHGINTARMAEVWMDEYAELFYLHRPDLRKNPKIGDVTHRKVLREKLHCKSFQWYLDNIYKDKFVPVREAFGYGRIRNEKRNLCLDTMMRDAEGSVLGLYPCHDLLVATQYFTLTLSGELRDEEKCAEVKHYSRRNNEDDSFRKPVIFSTCHAKAKQMKWRYIPDTQQIQHIDSGLCLESAQQSGGDAMVRPCESDDQMQKWAIDYSEINNFKREGSKESNEQQEILRKIREGRSFQYNHGHKRRRISRSLQSVADEADVIPDDRVNNTRKHLSHSRKKRKSKKKRGKKKKSKRSQKLKNKFVLKLIRTFMNNTEDHLEVDIHCKHKQLYPNNSFVRDLVTILNERNIKVINNGRVFDRSGVTDVDKHKQREGHQASQDKSLVPANVTPITPKPHEPESAQSLTESPQGVNNFIKPPKRSKIIVEDFVKINNIKEVTQQPKLTQRKRKRKHRLSSLSSPMVLPTESPLPRRQQEYNGEKSQDGQTNNEQNTPSDLQSELNEYLHAQDQPEKPEDDREMNRDSDHNVNRDRETEGMPREQKSDNAALETKLDEDKDEREKKNNEDIGQHERKKDEDIDEHERKRDEDTGEHERKRDEDIGEHERKNDEDIGEHERKRDEDIGEHERKGGEDMSEHEQKVDEDTEDRGEHVGIRHKYMGERERKIDKATVKRERNREKYIAELDRKREEGIDEQERKRVENTMRGWKRDRYKNKPKKYDTEIHNQEKKKSKMFKKPKISDIPTEDRKTQHFKKVSYIQATRNEDLDNSFQVKGEEVFLVNKKVKKDAKSRINTQQGKTDRNTRLRERKRERKVILRDKTDILNDVEETARGSNNENWAMGESKFRTGDDTDGNQIEPTQSQNLKPLIGPDDESLPLNASQSPNLRSNNAPLKVVMKSNLTFHLGDEFFSWRRKMDDDNEVVDLLEELEIPANITREPPTLQAWVLPLSQLKDSKKQITQSDVDADDSSDSNSSE